MPTLYDWLRPRWYVSRSPDGVLQMGAPWPRGPEAFSVSRKPCRECGRDDWGSALDGPDGLTCGACLPPYEPPRGLARVREWISVRVHNAYYCYCHRFGRRTYED